MQLATCFTLTGFAGEVCFSSFFSRNVKHPCTEDKENSLGAEKLQAANSLSFYRNLPTHEMELHENQ